MTMNTRIGVFICDCHGEIGDVIDIDKIMTKLVPLSEIVLTEKVSYGCSPHGEEKIQQRIKDSSLNRVVLLGCSPRIMEKRFKKICADAGLNPSLFEMVNLRDQCAWVTPNDPQIMNQKAWDLIQMGLEKARYLTPTKMKKAKIYPVVAVIGGGVAGMTAALSLANQYIRVILVEKSDRLGGSVGKFDYAFSNLNGDIKIIKNLSKQIQQSKNIEIILRAELEDVTGSYGEYEITLTTPHRLQKISCGAVILAMGASEWIPEGLYEYGKNKKVITQSDLHHLLAEGSAIEKLKNIVMIQCVGARNEKRPYCGRICCMIAIHHAILLKKKFPSLNVTILYRDIPTKPGPDRQTLHEAIKLGVKFLQFDKHTPPHVSPATIRGKTYDDTSYRLPYDLLILSTPPVASESSQRVAKAFHIPIDQYGFIPDTHPNLKPHQYSEPCIHVVGSAHWPCTVSEATYQAYERSTRIATLIKQGTVISKRATATVDMTVCRGCSTCLEWCPFDVPVIKPLNGGDPVSFIDPFLCKGCGSCVVHCPTGAATISNYDDETLQSMITSALSVRENQGIKIITFLCEWSGYAAADLAGTKRKQIPPEILPIRIPCAGRISTGLILHAFASGADGLLIYACKRGECHYLSGNTNCEKVTHETHNLLGLLGIHRSRFKMAHVNPTNVDDFCHSLENFVATIKKLEPATLAVEEVA